MRFGRLAAGLFALAAISTPLCAGENFRLLVLDGGYVKWGSPALGTRATVTYAFATKSQTFKDARNCGELAPLATLSTATGIPADVMRQEADAAFRQWEQAAGLSFRPAATPEAADILIGAQGQPTGLAYTNVELTEESAARGSSKGDLAASLSETAPRIGRIRQALVCLNPERPWKLGFDGNLEIYDLRYTFTHEIGHAIGLDHPGPTGALMGFRYEETSRGLMGGDIKAARTLYGPPAE